MTPRSSTPTPAGSDVEDSSAFRAAQLMLLLEGCKDMGKPVATIDRLAYYDFLCANPFLVVRGEAVKDSRDRTRLRVAGFLHDKLSYGTSSEQFLSRRERLRGDIAFLVSRDLVRLESSGYAPTSQGLDLCSAMHTLYADSYRTAVRLVVSRLAPLSDTKLEASAREWLGETWILHDLLDVSASDDSGSVNA